MTRRYIYGLYAIYRIACLYTVCSYILHGACPYFTGDIRQVLYTSPARSYTIRHKVVPYDAAASSHQHAIAGLFYKLYTYNGRV